MRSEDATENREICEELLIDLERSSFWGAVNESRVYLTA
jgi:hypothetical protein